MQAPLNEPIPDWSKSSQTFSHKNQDGEWKSHNNVTWLRQQMNAQQSDLTHWLDLEYYGMP